MHFNRSTDYALRVLTYLALKHGELATITEIAEAYDISRNHVMKIIYRLGQLGFITTLRGKHGGLYLGRPPAEIIIGDVIRKMENDWTLVECFHPEKSTCRIRPSCRLQTILHASLDAFLEVLDSYTLADLIEDEPALLHDLRT